MSQKANEYDKYITAFNAFAFDKKWKPLTTHRITMPTWIPKDGTVTPREKWEPEMRKKAEEAFSAMGNTNDTLFIRAAPIQPRPGVVESIPATGKEEFVNTVLGLADTMLGPDHWPKLNEKTGKMETIYPHGLCEPDGCMMVQKFIDATASAVMGGGYRDAEGNVVPGYIEIGLGHDGITAATGGYRIAMPVGSPQWMENIFNALDSDVRKHELEFISKLGDAKSGKEVFDHLHTTQYVGKVDMENYITQLRGCEKHRELSPPPKGVSINGLVPQGRVTVTEVYLCEGEMDDYAGPLEARLAQGFDEGFIVSHPDGTMNSHAASCCRAAGAPYILSPVEIGDSWIEVSPRWVVANDPSFEAQPYDPTEYIKEYQEGISVGLWHWTRMYAHLGNHFQQFINGPVSNPQQTAFLGGVYTGWLVNAVAAVAIGEMRHASSRRRGNHPAVYATLNGLFKGRWVQVDDTYSDVIGSNRQNYYYTMEKTPLTVSSLIMTLEWLSKMYDGKAWAGAFGGNAYMTSVDKAHELIISIDALVKDPTLANLNDTMGKANICKNTVHNTGFFFNKFVLKSTMDMACMDYVEPDLNQMFSIFYAAYGAESKRGVKPELMDITDTMEYILTRGPSSWRTTPIYQDDAAPAHLKSSIDALIKAGKGHLLHSGGGEITMPTTDKFVMCGHPDCELCKQHMNYLNENAQKRVQEAVAQVVGRQKVDLLDTGFSYDMWLTGTVVDTQEQDWLLYTCEGIYKKEIAPDVDMLQRMFATLNPATQHFSHCSTIMAKFFAKLGTKMLNEITAELHGEVLPDEVEEITLTNLRGQTKATKKYLVYNDLDDTFNFFYAESSEAALEASKEEKQDE
tara:strand:- start:7919 stop:10477 length:2559 start_codon:yes stop_codon:yes gene_type:complete